MAHDPQNNLEDERDNSPEKYDGYYFKLKDEETHLFAQTQKYLRENYGIAESSVIGTSLAAMPLTKFQALEERAKELSAIHDNFAGTSKAAVISTLGDLSELANKIAPGGSSAELNNHLIPLLKVFGERINPDLIDGLISFIEHENSGYKKNKEETISAIKYLARSLGEFLTAESFSLVLGTSLKADTKNSSPAIALKNDLIPFILINQHDLGDEKLQFMLERLPSPVFQRALIDDPLFSSIARLLSVPGLDLDAEDLRGSTVELELIVDEFAKYLGNPGVSNELAKFILGAGAALSYEKIKDARTALQFLGEINFPPACRASFLAVTTGMLITKLSERYQPGDIQLVANSVSKALANIAQPPDNLPSEHKVVSYLAILNRVVSYVGDSFVSRDLGELCDSINYVVSKFEDQGVNGYFATMNGVLPALSNLSSLYHPGLLKELTDRFSSELKRSNLDAHACHSFLIGLGNAISCLKPGFSLNDISKVADSVKGIVNIDALTGKNLFVSSVLIPAMQSLTGKLTPESLLTLTNYIEELHDSLYSPDRLRISLPKALAALGLEKGMFLHRTFLQTFIEPRLEFLSSREIQELYYILYSSRDPGQLIQTRTQQVLAGKEPLDVLSKILALDLVKAEARDELDAPTIGKAISEAMQRPVQAGLAKPLGIDILTDRSEESGQDGFHSNFRLTITRGLLDALHGAFEGKPLKHDYRPQTVNSDYQPIRILGVGGELYGLINTRGLLINGRRSLVVTKIDLCQNTPVTFPGSKIIDRVFLTLKIISQRNGMDLYLNSGGSNWPEDGGLGGSTIIRQFCKHSFKDIKPLDLRENSPSYPELNNLPARYLVRIQKTDKSTGN